MRFSTGADATDGSCRNVTADATRSSRTAMMATVVGQPQLIHPGEAFSIIGDALGLQLCKHRPGWREGNVAMGEEDWNQPLHFHLSK